MNLVPQCPVVVVAGTNGKGSVCAYLSHIYKEAGFKVGTLTSPHLLRYNERIAINLSLFQTTRLFPHLSASKRHAVKFR